MSQSGMLHCPCEGCAKPLLVQVAMAEGTRFVMKCPHCSGFVRVVVSHTQIHKRELRDQKDRCILNGE